MTPEELEIAYKIAKAHYETYVKLAPDYGYQAHIILWEDLLPIYRELMVGIIASLLDNHTIKPGD